MATKTISIDLEAYETLRRARRRRDESFSQVIKRGRWETVPSTGAALLEALAAAPIPADDVLERLDEAQRGDTPPRYPWTE